MWVINDLFFINDNGIEEWSPRIKVLDCHDGCNGDRFGSLGKLVTNALVYPKICFFRETETKNALLHAKDAFIAKLKMR